MALNLDRIGHSYSPYRYEISREKVREYAQSVGLHEGHYAAEDGEVVAPPTFAACFTVTRGAMEAFGDPELGAHPGVVHGAQAYEVHRPMRVGDALHCTPVIADIQHKGRNELLTLRIDCVDEATGEPVVTSTGTIVFLGSAPQDGQEGS